MELKELCEPTMLISFACKIDSKAESLYTSYIDSDI